MNTAPSSHRHFAVRLVYLLSMIMIFTAAAAVTPSTAANMIVLPRTGQTLCFPTDGQGVDPIACAGTGQDGELQKGAAWPAPRFTDNGNGSITDNLTSLIWLKNTVCTDTVAGITPGTDDPTGTWPSALTWYHALTWSNNLASGKCGLSDNSKAGDWRLANANEALSLIDLQQSRPALPLNNPFVGPADYMELWTSTTEMQTSNSNHAWNISIQAGTLGTNLKTYAKPFWVVKGTATNVLKTGQVTCYDSQDTVTTCTGTSGQDGDLKKGVDETGRTLTSANGTITDPLTGLVWLKNGNCQEIIAGVDKKTGDGSLVFADALKWTKGLASGMCGLSDGSVAGSWRIPNLNELRTLILYQSSGYWRDANSNHTLLNNLGFSGIMPNEYWSSSSEALSPWASWYTDFGNGGIVVTRSKSLMQYVLPVRGGNTVASTPVTLSKAKVYLGADDIFTVSSSGTMVYGSSGNDTVIIAPGVTGVILDQNVERINFSDASTNHKFKQTGNKINVYDAAGTTLIVSVPVQSGGTLLSFTNHTDLAALTAGVINLTLATPPATPSPVPATKAKVYLGTDDTFTVSSSGTTLYGGPGNDTVTISAGVSAVVLDQNVERVNFSGTSGSYTFKQTGNKINVYDTTGSTLIVTAPVQGDADGTVLGFSDGPASAKLTAGVMTVAGVAVSSTTPPAITPASNAQGFWSGTTDSNRTVRGLMLSDGSYYFLYTPVGVPTSLAGVVQGTGNTTSGSFSSSDAHDFNLHSVNTITFSATFNPKQSLSGTFTNAAGQKQIFTGTYDAGYDTVPTLSVVTATYSGSSSVLTGGAQSASITVSAAGLLSGSAIGCSLTGAIKPRTDGNVYDASLTFGAAPCTFANQTLNGIAYYNSTSKLLYIITPNAARTSGVIFIGTSAPVTATPTLASIAVTPGNPTIVKGSTQQLVATGAYTNGTTADITSSVTWSSATPAAATVSSTGLLSGVAAGTSTITATKGSVSSSAIATVIAATTPSATFQPSLVGTWIGYPFQGIPWSYSFYADGTFMFEVTQFYDSYGGGCLMMYYADSNVETGNVSLSGTSLTLNVTGGAYKTWECSPMYTYTYFNPAQPTTSSPNPPRTVHYTWRLSGNTLYLTDSKGEVAYTKQ